MPADRKITLYSVSVLEVCCNKCEYHCSGCVGPILLCQGTVKIQTFVNARQLAVCVRVTQANETAVPGVQELCGKGTSTFREGCPCVNVLHVVDQCNLLTGVCWG